MKKHFIKIASLFVFALVYSCSSGNHKDNGAAQNTKKADTIKQCYTANFEGDSAKMSLNIIDSINVEGKLSIHYAEKPQNEGSLKGSFKGDTLMVYYTFKTGNNPTEFSNPLAFLKSGEQLKMGVGVIETSMGRSYFAKDKPINFEQGKFNFAPTTCP